MSAGASASSVQVLGCGVGLGLSRCFGRCIVIGMLTGIIAFVDLVVVVILEWYVKCMVSKNFLPRQLHSIAVRRDDDQ